MLTARRLTLHLRLLAVLLLSNLPIWAESFYISPTGSDSNRGTNASQPWLTPNHPLSCGDTITAARGVYDQANFEFGKWGKVACSGHGVAWLICQTFDACKISATGQPGIWITASHWGVQGWEVTESGDNYSCFSATPPDSTSSIEDIIFANDIANRCYGAGFTSPPNGNAGVDYIAIIGVIAYDAAQQSSECASGISLVEPVNADSAPGTHIFVSQTFTWGNINPNPCGGTGPTDGEGVIFDTWSGLSYTGQGVIENNIAFFNGSLGFEIWNNGSSNIYVVNNTSASNLRAHDRSTALCGEIGGGNSLGKTEFYRNIARVDDLMSCGPSPPYAYVFQQGKTSDYVHDTLGYSANGRDYSCQDCNGFSLGPRNKFAIDPSFADAPAFIPAPPNCTPSANVINCMSPIIADFVARSAPAEWGYQRPSVDPVFDPLYPSWLCTVNLPQGIVSQGCARTSAKSGVIDKQRTSP